uniref:Uncharacterized protein n=2 Tax=Caenorhabditis japonica TaxID=281687 RepID=A0A8R1HPH2_CAEJA
MNGRYRMELSDKESELNRLNLDIERTQRLINDPYTSSQTRATWYNEINTMALRKNMLETAIDALRKKISNSSGSWFSRYNLFANNHSEDARIRLEAEQRRAEDEKRRIRRKQDIEAEQAALDEEIKRATALSRLRNKMNQQQRERELQDHIANINLEQEKIMIERRNEDRNLSEKILEAQRMEEQKRARTEKSKRELVEKQRYDEWRRDIDRKSLEQKELTSNLIRANQNDLDLRDQSNLIESEQRRHELMEIEAQHAKQREAALRELHEKEQEVRMAQEESRRIYEAMARKTREQMDEIMRMLKNAQWGRTIEANWNSRIKALKSTDRRVHKAIGILKMQLAVAKIQDSNSELIRKDIDRLKFEISETKKVMDREVDNLDKMYNFSGKQFVLDISDSLLTISKVCHNFSEYLDSQYSFNFEKARAREVYDKVNEYEYKFIEAYIVIPTIDSLKLKFSSSWPTSTGNDNDGDFFFIEEVE